MSRAASLICSTACPCMFKGHRLLQEENTDPLPVFMPESENDLDGGTFIFGSEDDDEEEEILESEI